MFGDYEKFTHVDYKMHVRCRGNATREHASQVHVDLYVVPKQQRERPVSPVLPSPTLRGLRHGVHALPRV